MKFIKCNNCNKEFVAKRKDAKFCSSTCRSKYWLKNRKQKLTEADFQNQVRGLVPDSGKPGVTSNPKTKLSTEYLNESSKIISKNAEIRALDNKVKLLERELNSFANEFANPYAIIGTTAGAYIGYCSADNRLDKPDKRLNSILGGIGGLITGIILDSTTKESREKQCRDEIQRIQQDINKINVSKTFLRKQIDALSKGIKSIDKFTIVHNGINISDKKGIDVNGENNAMSTGVKSNLNVSKHIHKPDLKATEIKTNEKIIRSTELARMMYNSLDLTGKWLELFGQPSVNFHCAVHGMAGEGKSTFCILFAHYLAVNFGSVIYVSGEEGFSKTMKDKIVNNDALSDELAIADLRNFKELIEEIKPNTFNFIFIDSLDNMQIGAHELKELRKQYAASALITISQNTKDGKIRGSYEIVHDSDIAVSVSKGVATTVKNRFLEKGKSFNIF